MKWRHRREALGGSVRMQVAGCKLGRVGDASGKPVCAMPASHHPTLHLAFRADRRKLLLPVQTAPGVWSVREGVIVRLEDGDGRVGYGEAAPIPALQRRRRRTIWRGCDEPRNKLSVKQIQRIPKRLACVQWAVSCALAMLEGQLNPPAKPRNIPLAILLPDRNGRTQCLGATERGRLSSI